MSDADEVGAASVDYLFYSGYVALAFWWTKSVAAAAFRRRLPEMSEVHGASLTPRPIHDLSAMQGGDQRTGHIALVRMALTDQLG